MPVTEKKLCKGKKNTKKLTNISSILDDCESCEVLSNYKRWELTYFSTAQTDFRFIKWLVSLRIDKILHVLLIVNSSLYVYIKKKNC